MESPEPVLYSFIMANVGELTASSFTPRALHIAVVNVVFPAPMGAKNATILWFPISFRNSPAALSRSLRSCMVMQCFMFMNILLRP